jgi:hypothetical protein
MRYLSIYKTTSICLLKIASSLHYCQSNQRKFLKQGENITLNIVISCLSFSNSNAHENTRIILHTAAIEGKNMPLDAQPTSTDPPLAASINLKLKFRPTKWVR